MPKRTVIFNIILILFFTSIFGQKDTLDKKTFFAIKTDVVILSLNAFGVVNLGSLTFEKGFSHRHSFQLTGSYVKYKHFKSKSWSLIPEYKIFINRKNNFKGFYTGLYLKYENRFDSDLYSSGYGGDKYITKRYQNYGAGITFGFQTYIKKHLTIDFLLGLGDIYITRQVDVPPNTIDANYYNDGKYPITRIDGRACINLGYKF